MNSIHRHFKTDNCVKLNQEDLVKLSELVDLIYTWLHSYCQCISEIYQHPEQNLFQSIEKEKMIYRSFFHANIQHAISDLLEIINKYLNENIIKKKTLPQKILSFVFCFLTGKSRHYISTHLLHDCCLILSSCNLHVCKIENSLDNTSIEKKTIEECWAFRSEIMSCRHELFYYHVINSKILSQITKNNIALAQHLTECPCPMSLSVGKKDEKSAEKDDLNSTD